MLRPPEKKFFDVFRDQTIDLARENFVDETDLSQSISLSSFKPSQCADEMNACEEVSGSFLVARCDTPEVLDVIEEALDEIALCIECVIAVARNLAV